MGAAVFVTYPAVHIRSNIPIYVVSVRNMRTKKWDVGDNDRHYLYYTKIGTKIKVLKGPTQNPLALLVKIIASRHKALRNRQVHKFSKSLGATSDFYVPGR